VLSIAAGVPTERIESWLWSGVRVLRAMPNTPALLGVGASAVAPGTNATEDDVIWAESVLSAIGMVVSLPEELLDATTGLSGSGPAYIFLVAEALIAAGIEVGLSPEVSRVLTLQTVLGAARMLSESGESPEELRAAVTSPNGTTAEGIKVMEERGLREILSAAVRAATERSKELGRG
jgi:pyrroline-5-carboxylate reductase